MLSLSHRGRRNITWRVGLAGILLSCTVLIAAEPAHVAYGEPSSTNIGTFIYLPVISYGAPPCNDIEENDVPGQARPLVPLNQECAGSFQDDPVAEDDYYSVSLTDGQTLTVELTEIPAEADYDLIVYPPNSSKEVVTSNESGNVDERVSYTVPSGGAGSYLIRLNIYAKSVTASNSYVLRADIQ